MPFSALLLCPCIIEQSRPSEGMSNAEVRSDDPLGFELQQDKKPPTKSSKLGKVILGVTGAAAVGLVLVTTPFVTPALRKVCLPYVPATEKQIVNILSMAKTFKGPGSTLVDLGSGDGRVVCIILLLPYAFDYSGVNNRGGEESMLPEPPHLPSIVH